jgi:guanidinopropionase
MKHKSDTPQPFDATIVPRFAQVGTFMRCPLRTSAAGIDIAMAGVPWDAGTPNRTGSRHGPAQIREMSRLLRRYNFATRVSPFDDCAIADLGDAPINPFDVLATLASVQRFFAEICSASALPLAVGGDHLITLPVLRTVGRQRPVGLIHFDAHADTMDTLFGQRYHSGSPLRRAVEEGVLDPARAVSIGLRGTQFSADDTAFNRAHGMTVVTIEDFFEAGPKAVAGRAREVVGEGPVYVTFDVDVLDPVYAPGTGGLEPGGPSMRDCQVMLRALDGLDIVGADVNEVSPPLDTSGLTALHACNIIFELLCIMASALRARRSA